MATTVLTINVADAVTRDRISRIGNALEEARRFNDHAWEMLRSAGALYDGAKNDGGHEIDPSALKDIVEAHAHADNAFSAAESAYLSLLNARRTLQRSMGEKVD